MQHLVDGTPTEGEREFKTQRSWVKKTVEALEALPLETKNEHARKRLSPHWVEALMGFPAGWTEPDGPPRLANLNTPGSRQDSMKNPASTGRTA
jgi:hypothetical protein